MKLTKTLNYGIITGVIFSALSFFIPIIPCKTSPVIAEPKYSWTLCKLPNPFKEPLLGISTKYLGFSTNPLAALITVFLLILIIFFIISIILRKKQGKVVDLTEKRRK